MFGSCEWPLLRKAWTRHNSNPPSELLAKRSTLKRPKLRPPFVALLFAITFIVHPRDVFGQTEPEPHPRTSTGEIDNNDHHWNQQTTPPWNKIVDGGVVSKVRRSISFKYYWMTAPCLVPLIHSELIDGNIPLAFRGPSRSHFKRSTT